MITTSNITVFHELAKEVLSDANRISESKLNPFNDEEAYLTIQKEDMLS